MRNRRYKYGEKILVRHYGGIQGLGERTFARKTDAFAYASKMMTKIKEKCEKENYDLVGEGVVIRWYGGTR